MSKLWDVRPSCRKWATADVDPSWGKIGRTVCEEFDVGISHRLDKDVEFGGRGVVLQLFVDRSLCVVDKLATFYW